MDEFVPRDFDVPLRLEEPQFVLEPLGAEHNEQDYDAWTSSRGQRLARVRLAVRQRRVRAARVGARAGALSPPPG